MLKKFIHKLRNKKSFSLIEVVVAIFIVSITIFSVVEVYRYIFLSSSKNKDFEVMIRSINKVYYDILLGNIEFKGYIETNINGVEIVVKAKDYLETEPFIGDIIIYATNKGITFSVISAIY